MTHLLKVTGLRTWLKSERGPARAVDGVSVTLDRGQTLGVVGESGSGKTMFARSVMGLIPKSIIERSEGVVCYEGRDIQTLPDDELRDVWGEEIAMIFQNPLTSLNPVVTIGRQITESLNHHLHMGRREAKETAIELLRSVGIPEPEERFHEYPHQLSGGMRQRVGIAIALACGPNLLIADEPTTALDVTVQRQILDLLRQQQIERNMGVILISHDLGVVAGRTDQIAVMYAGRIVEHASTPDLFGDTQHPYTEALLRSIPNAETTEKARLASIPGRPPDLVVPPTGCSFAPRCAYAQDKCLVDEPTLVAGESGHSVACFFPVGSARGIEARDRNRQAGETAAGTPVGLNTAGSL